MNRSAPANNPFGATAPLQVVCVESRPLATRQDGTVWIFVALDACSRYAFHHNLSRTNTLPDYVTFIHEVLRKEPDVQQAKLALDTDPGSHAAFAKLFPQFKQVLCDQAKVAVVTEEFHVAFLAHMGSQGRGN
jgi:hypothetical protein